jgi:surface antigen
LQFGLALALALNCKWLELLPVKSFLDKDWELLRQAARTELEDKADGESVKWHNEESGHYGSITSISRL